MKILKKYFLPLVPGAVYGAAVTVLSQLLLRFSGQLFSLAGGAAGLDAGTVSYGAQVLGQLREATLGSPWLLTLGCSVLFALLGRLTAGRRGWRVALWILAAALVLPLVLWALWCTRVNGVYLGDLLDLLLPLLPALF